MANELGRNRKPSALRQLEGNRSRRDIPPDLPLEGLPECPDSLGAEAAEHFRFVAGELGACGVVKRLDAAALSVLADMWEKYWIASRALDIDGMCKLLSRWSLLASKFGLTPADRAKIMATARDKTDETEERYFQVTG